MSKVIFDSGISLDGFFAGENRGPQNPMGGVSGQIHGWMFHQKAFWEYLGFEGGKEDGVDGRYIRETIARTGAFIMGKRMFEEGKPAGLTTYTKLMFMCSPTKSVSLGCKKELPLFISLMTALKVP